VYVGAKYFLQLLVIELTILEDWLQALEDIQTIIGNDVFDGKNELGEVYLLSRMETIRDQLQSCPANDLVCFAALEIPEIEAALTVEFAAIKDKPLPVPPEYTFGQANNDTFTFDIQTADGIQTFTGKITHVANGEVEDTYTYPDC
jgi:hypothetical protein